MTTLFGGLALVFVIYSVAGAFRRLSPILRAALAGLVPLLGYFVLIIGRWPGLDVVAIHISVFLAGALVLFALTRFRQAGAGRMHWVPKLLTAFFVSLVLLNASLLYIATNGLPTPLAQWWFGSDGKPVHSGFSGVVAHGQGAAKAVSSELSETHRESQIGWQVELNGLDDQGATREVRIRVRDRTGLPVERVQAELQLSRPGATAPISTLVLNPGKPGEYSATLALPAAGRWLAELRLRQAGVLRYTSTTELVLP
jgi:nitrogen fixation protein FixH